MRYGQDQHQRKSQVVPQLCTNMFKNLEKTLRADPMCCSSCQYGQAIGNLQNAEAVSGPILKWLQLSACPPLHFPHVYTRILAYLYWTDDSFFMAVITVSPGYKYVSLIAVE